MRILKFTDGSDFWVATQKPGHRPQLLTFTYGDDAPAWDLVDLLEKLANRLGIRTTSISYDIQPLMHCFVTLLENSNPKKVAKARQTLQQYGITRTNFNDEEEFLSYLLRYHPKVLEGFKQE